LLTATLSIAHAINLESLRPRLARYGNTVWTFDWSKWDVETICMSARRGFGMLPIVQADGVAIAPKLD
jgi:hypothetical protein